MALSDPLPPPDPSDAAVLVTRPEPEATSFAAAIRSLGLSHVFIAPMTEVAAVPGLDVSTSEADAILFTSPRALPFAQGLEALPAYTVGRASAEAAARAGFTVAGEGPGRADQRLVSLVPPGTRLLHLAGKHIAHDLQPPFEAHGVRYRRVVVYEAKSVPSLSAEGQRFLALEKQKFVTFLSARAVSRFAELSTDEAVSSPSPVIMALCVSDRVAEAAQRCGRFSKIHVTHSVEPARFVDFIQARRT